MQLWHTLLVLLTLAANLAASPISVEDFSKISDHAERWKIIEEAPADQQAELKRIDMHLVLLLAYTTEANLKLARESLVAKARGFTALEGIFKDRFQLFLRDAGDSSNIKNDAAFYSKLDQGTPLLFERLARVHQLVFNLAVSPAALALEKRAEQMRDQMQEHMMSTPQRPGRLITTAERAALNNELDEMAVKLEQLPKLSPEQAQKEYDDFPEANVYRNWPD